MNFADIVTKQNYPKDFIPFLKKVYDAFVDFLGKDKEPIIFNALLNTKLVFNRNVYDVLNEMGVISSASEIVKDSDLKRAGGINESIPIIVYQNGKFEISDITRVVVLSHFDINSVSWIGVFIHELGHLFKSYYNEYKIEGDILIVKSGFIEERYKLNYIDGKVKETLISETGIGLEEGLNTNLEEKIMQKYFDASYVSHGYAGVHFTTHIIEDKFNLKDMFLNAQIYKDFREVLEYFGTDLLGRVKTLEDRFYRLDLEIYANALNKEKFTELVSEQKRLIASDFQDLIRDIEERRKLCQK